MPAGRTISQLVQNIDLYPTFVQLEGGTSSSSIDGHSLVPLLLGQPATSWRTAALVEHHGPDNDVNDIDYESRLLSGNPTSYEAIRLANAVYVEYINGDREYYRIDKDPEEQVNAFNQLSVSTRTQLHAIVTALSQCHGATNCWAAGRPV